VTLGFTGRQPSAERMVRLCDVCVRAPLQIMEQIEDLHVIIHHAVSMALRARVTAWNQAFAPVMVAD